MGHTLNSPSSMSRRRACAGSARMEKDLPDSESVYAAEGTAAHALGEKCLLTGTDPWDHIGLKLGDFVHPDGTIEEFIVDGDMCDAVSLYVNHCRPLFSERVTRIEKKFNLPFLGKGEKGTVDFCSISSRILHVVDYKHGRGVPVGAVENVQGLSYGLGAAEEFINEDWDTLRITIVQPRSFHPLGSIRSWDVAKSDLIDWKLDLGTAAFNTGIDFAPLKAGDHCMWCKAAFFCRELTSEVERITKMMFDDPNSKPVEPDQLTDEEIADIVLNKASMIKRWVATLEDYAQKRGEEKNPLPGTKLVKTREKRTWADEKEATKVFSMVDGAYKKTFLTAPQMEKLLGKKKFENYEHLVKKVSTGVTIVPADDPRPSARPTGEDEFGAVDLF